MLSTAWFGATTNQTEAHKSSRCRQINISPSTRRGCFVAERGSGRSRPLLQKFQPARMIDESSRFTFALTPSYLTAERSVLTVPWPVWSRLWVGFVVISTSGKFSFKCWMSDTIAVHNSDSLSERLDVGTIDGKMKKLHGGELFALAVPPFWLFYSSMHPGGGVEVVFWAWDRWAFLSKQLVFSHSRSSLSGCAQYFIPSSKYVCSNLKNNILFFDIFVL